MIETTEEKLPHLYATGVRVAYVLPCYDRVGGGGDMWHPDYVAPEPLLIPPGYRLTIEVSRDGVFSVRRDRL